MIDHKQYMEIAKLIANSSRSERKKVGCILVKDNNIISIGYNGTPHGFDNCCEIDGVTKKEVIHAEANAIVKCAKTSYSCEGCVMYTTYSPCIECSKLIVQAGIKKIYISELYYDLTGLDLLTQANIEYEII